MSEDEFDLMLALILGRSVTKMSDIELMTLITMTQAATDRLLNEWERRGLLEFSRRPANGALPGAR